MSIAQVIGGRIGSYRRWAKTATADRAAATAKARAAFLRRFDAEVDPEAARRAYYAELALRRHRISQARKRAAR